MATSTVAAPALTKYKMFIGGQWVEAESGEHFESDNPYTGKPWALIPRDQGRRGPCGRCRPQSLHVRRLAAA